MFGAFSGRRRGGGVRLWTDSSIVGPATASEGGGGNGRDSWPKTGADGKQAVKVQTQKGAVFLIDRKSRYPMFLASSELDGLSEHDSFR